MPTRQPAQFPADHLPFLRWAGGKRKLIARLVHFVPKDYQKRIYREPFMGAGCMYFALQPRKGVLSDANQHLIACHEHIRDDWRTINRYLREHSRKTSEKHYYAVRKAYNTSRPSAAQAARFIYLNKACFNGIFRVNTKGKFNVPYGWKEPPALPSSALLRSASRVLRSASLLHLPYDEAMQLARSGDFIYLDPPYPPLNGTAYFTHYTSARFSIDDQKSLAQQVHQLDRRGCLIMMSNADTPLIRRLYRKFHLVSLPVTRYLTCKSLRHKVDELIITNYEVLDHVGA